METILGSLLEFIRANLTAFVILLALLLVIFIRSWPDAATFAFLLAGVRGGRHIEEYRRSLAENVTRLGKRLREAASEQQLRIQAVNLERERIQHLVRANPLLVREVGRALIEVEREYVENRRRIRSDQGREVLRLAAERRINELLQSLDIPAASMPPFRIYDDPRPPQRT